MNLRAKELFGLVDSLAKQGWIVHRISLPSQEIKGLHKDVEWELPSREHLRMGEVGNMKAFAVYMCEDNEMWIECKKKEG